MVLRDFESGGFPVTKRSPVICTVDEDEKTVLTASNRYDLKHIIVNHEIISCVGVWPGKKNTDCFVLEPNAYLIAPPERYKDIDNATEIKVFYNSEGYLVKIIYETDGTTVESDNQALMGYIENIKLKHQNFYAK